MNQQTCCFTGHRSISVREYPKIQNRLEIALVALIRQGVRYFCAGGALGFDTMAALSVLKLKEKHPHIRLFLALPCKNQADSWRDADKKIYNHILQHADRVVYISENYYSGCMHVRNRFLVEHSSVCLCYATRPGGGTFYTLSYAKQKGLSILNLAAD